MGSIRERVGSSDICVVVSAGGVVLGVLREEELRRATRDETAEDAMRPGPSTYRPHVPITEMIDQLERNDLSSVPITRSNGTLIGVLYLQDARKAAEAP